MVASPSDLFTFLSAHNIAHETIEHAPTFSVEDGRQLKAGLPGGHSKNLFMKDKAGHFVLVSAWADSELRLNRLHRLLGTRRLSFTDADALFDILGVRPGSVTAFALINDQINRTVRFIADARLMTFETIYFHPLINTATTAIASRDLLKFTAATGHGCEIIDFEQLL